MVFDEQLSEGEFIVLKRLFELDRDGDSLYPVDMLIESNDDNLNINTIVSITECLHDKRLINKVITRRIYLVKINRKQIRRIRKLIALK
jgi:hypothetical protein